MSAKLSILVQRVRAALQNDSRTHDAAVDVVEEGGSITLTGTVATENGRQAAGEIARKQEGVIQVINEVCEELQKDEQWGPDLITTPSVLRVNNLGNHGVDIKILGDTKPIKQWGLMGELRKRLKRRFDQEGIEIPWPHSKVYFGNSMETVGPAMVGD